VIGFVWFLVAGFKALYRNYKFGDPNQAVINRFLFTYFTVKVIMFVFIFGGFYSDLVYFTGAVGFSVALNGGIRSPVVEPITHPAVSRFKLAYAAR